MTRAYITTYNNIRFLLIYEDDVFVECHPVPEEQGLKVGNIYIGRVEKIVKNIRSAFVCLDGEHVGYLPLDDKPAHILNRSLPNGLPSIAEGDTILVQVEQEAQKLKQARITGNITLSGNYVVLDLQDKPIGVSKKIHAVERTQTLRKLAESANLPYGVILRTACGDAKDETVRSELETLAGQMNQIIRQAQYKRGIGLIAGAPPEYFSILKAYGVSRIAEIVTDIGEVRDTLLTLLSGDASDTQEMTKLRFYDDEYTLDKLLDLKTCISGLLNKKVWLKSGGFLIIEPTEAMVVIDVNTGKSIGKRRQEEHLLRVNLEAAQEIARQLRLRNLSGIILVDFINMNHEGHRKMVADTLRREFQKDKVMTQLIDVTQLELYEITRKKIRKPLHEII